ncbi:MAG: ABC transporter substrate-binding protein [Deltaproteobacteria bacterium]|nr:ABC transporter substrate-binding protein [Deltaproteobacteria bacterium]MBW2017135.1 ABC transporter substrate-binding protein [Deltaproteobacteria bacterium]MBW2130193.1 ABC transporter substrate-binding protein [Deltaproteobacteria bacterium]MBW2304127.1 ABC transporter substrate-binding protein [Deltaproteobacteria bacterium]
MKRVFGIMAMVFLFALISTTGALAGDTLGVGLCAPMSGGAASWGKKAEVGTRFAIERINAAGGVVPRCEGKAKKLELIEVADDKNDPREGAAIAQRFVDNPRILAMIGPITSTVALAGAPILNKHGLVQLAIGATAPSYTNAGPYSFRVVPTDAFQGRYIAQWAKSQGRWSRFATIYVNDDYGRGLNEMFVKAMAESGGKVVASEAFLPNDTDFSVQLAKIKSLKADALFIAGHYKEGALIARQARELGMKVQILGTDGIGHPEYIKVAGKAAEGTYYSGYFSLKDKRPYVQKWAADFKKKYGRDPGLVEGLANDCVLLVAKAIELGGADRLELAVALSSIGPYRPPVMGAMGENQFDANGDMVRDMLMYVVKGGVAVLAQ